MAAVLAHKQETGALEGLRGAESITNEELLLLECDVLAPCALEQVITSANADQVKAKIIAEGANGPITPTADEILDDKGVLVLPDILANAGGVVVSYFEWVQGLQEYFWKEPEVNSKLRDIVTRAFNETWHVSEERDIAMRPASYGVGRARRGRDHHSGALSLGSPCSTRLDVTSASGPSRRCARCGRSSSSS